MINELLDQAWRRGWLSRPPLDPEALVAGARTQSGLHDAGDDNGWRERLDLLAEALQNEAALTPLGRTIAHGQLVAAIGNRLRAHALWRRHPEILDLPVRAPIIVVGQMRSGSTRMQRLLACDPRFAFTRFFESWNPLPRAVHWGMIDDRRLRGWLALRCARLLNPEFDAIHPAAATQADEEIGFHNVSIFGSAFEAQWRVPSFTAHGEETDTQPIYAEFKRLLQTVAWLRSERGERPWVLKVPQMTQDLEAVLAVFPDARLICLERDAAALVASSASLAHSQMRLQSDQADRRWIGREWLRKVALRQQRAAAARSRAAAPEVEIAFEAMNRDWRTEMRRVYALLDVDLTAGVEQRMARYLARPRHARLAAHRYSLADFDLTEEDVARALNPSRPPADQAAADEGGSATT